MGNTDLKAGTAGGVALTILVHIGTDLLHTALTAIIGAFVSFTVSRLLQKWWGDKPRR